jgi:hypothetical protein
MKFPIILLLACAVRAAHQQAMEECKAGYGAVQHSRLWQQRYMYIEACFKEKTGMYPFQTPAQKDALFVYR